MTIFKLRNHSKSLKLFTLDLSMLFSTITNSKLISGDMAYDQVLEIFNVKKIHNVSSKI